MTRDDVVRITEVVLSELRLEIEAGRWTNPNSRTIVLKLGDREITSVNFDVVQKREYEG